MIGYKVKFTMGIDQYPHGKIEIGDFGRVKQFDYDENNCLEAIHIKMDKHFPGFEEWDNCLVLGRDNFPGPLLEGFFESIEIVDRPLVRVRISIKKHYYFDTTATTDDEAIGIAESLFENGEQPTHYEEDGVDTEVLGYIFEGDRHGLS